MTSTNNVQRVALTPLERSRAMQDATPWRPEAGGSITGAVIDVRRATSEHGPYPLVIMETEPDTFSAVHAFHYALKQRLKDVAPKTLDVITITYYGIVDLEGDKRLHDYDVALGDGKTPQAVNWDRF